MKFVHQLDDIVIFHLLDFFQNSRNLLQGSYLRKKISPQNSHFRCHILLGHCRSRHSCYHSQHQNYNLQSPGWRSLCNHQLFGILFLYRQFYPLLFPEDCSKFFSNQLVGETNIIHLQKVYRLSQLRGHNND